MWQLIVINILITVLLVGGLLAGFFYGIMRPYVDKKMAELMAAADSVEGKVQRGAKAGVAEAFKELPETTLKGSTRQMAKLGSELFENGLSAFLGSADDLRRRSNGRRD
ncbi:MAG: hypothetical protein LAT63_11050 [Marinobacter sp.]|nr:hypothetical protein [Marinobacter sp.]